MTTEEERDLLRTLVDSLPDYIYTKDDQSRFMVGNTAVARLMGAESSAELVGKTDFDYFPADLAENFRANELAVIESDQPLFDREEPLIDSAGKEHWLLTTKIPLHDDQGKVTGVVGIGRDITFRKQLQQQIEQSLTRHEHQVKLSIALAQGIATVPTLDDLFKRVIDLIQKHTDYLHVHLYTLKEDQLVLQAGGDDISQADDYRISLADDQSLLVGVARSGNAWWSSDVSKSSEWVANDLLPQTQAQIIEPIKLGDTVLGVLDVQNDTPGSLDEEDHLALMGLCGQLAVALNSAQTQAELLLERDLLQALMDNSPDHIFFRDRQSRFIRTNKAHSQLLLGIDDPADAIGLTDFDLYPKEDAQRFFDEEQQIMETRQPVLKREWSIPSPNLGGENVWSVEHKIPITDKNDEVIGLLAFGRDITERKRAESELARERDLLQSLMDNSPDYLFFKDKESAFIRTNHAHAQDLLGLNNSKEAIGLTDFDLFPQEDAQRFFDEEQEIMRTGKPVVRREWMLPSISKAGDTVWLSENKLPIADNKGEVIGLIGMSRDVTDRKKAEAMLAKQATELETVAQVGTATATILQSQELLQTVIDLTRDKFNLYHAHIYLLNEDKDTLILVAGAGDVGRQMVEAEWSIPLATKQSLIARVARLQQGEIVNNVRSEPNWLPNSLLPNTHAELAVPLIEGDRMWGVLDIQADKADYFTKDDIRVQNILAAQIAVALQNAHLFEQVTRANQEIKTLNEQLKNENLRMEAELNVTRQLQQILLPSDEELQQVEGLDIAGFMEPADEVGGDYYDVLQHKDQVKIGIGDVTGHGLESGVVMLMLQTAVRTLLTSDETDPVQFMNILNQTLYHNIQRMATDKNLTLSLFDYKKGQVRVSGQHEEVIVVRKGGQIELVDTLELGFPLGLELEIAELVGELSIDLQSGDGLVLYTDGITEAENEAEEFYGIEQLSAVVSRSWSLASAQGIRKAIIDDVRHFIGNQKIYDDLTFLVIRQQ